MTQLELVLRPHIEQRHQIGAQSRDQIIPRYGLERVAGLEVVGHHTIDLGNVPFADPTQRFDQCHHFGVAGEAIENVLAATLRVNETRAPDRADLPDVSNV